MHSPLNVKERIRFFNRGENPTVPEEQKAGWAPEPNRTV